MSNNAKFQFYTSQVSTLDQYLLNRPTIRYIPQYRQIPWDLLNPYTTPPKKEETLDDCL